MEIERQELVKALEQVKPALSERGILEGADCIIFNKDIIMAYNDTICIKYPIETDISLAVKGKDILKVISNIDSDTIKLKQQGESLRIKGGNVSAKFVGIESANIVELTESLNADTWNDLPTDFSDGVKSCLFSTSNDATKPYLMCLYIYENIIASADNQRVSEYKMSSSIDDTFLIYAKSCIELQHFQPTKYSLGSNWVFFTNEKDSIFASRVVVHDFPSYSNFFEFDGGRIKLPDKLRESIEPVSIMTEDVNFLHRRVDIVIKNEKLKINGKGNRGWVSASMGINTKKEFEFEINPAFLFNILERTNKIKVGERFCMFSTNNFKHLVLLNEG